MRRIVKGLLALGTLLSTVLVGGCASTPLDAVRDFADETKKISNAFDPVLDRAVVQCQQQFLQRRIYTSDRPLADFDATDTIKSAAANCRSIAEANPTARGISRSLAAYATQLSRLAADGVATSVDDDFDALAARIGAFPDVPPEKVDAINALLRFITRAAIAKSQHDAIVEALSHEDAVGTLADALVTYTERVWGGYVSDRLRDQPVFVEVLKAETATPISSRLRVMEVHQQTLLLQEQHRTTAALRKAVTQMKASMRDLRANVDRLSDKERLIEVRRLARDVRGLYQQLAAAF